MKRAVIYARYSTELQRDESIEDQIRVCQEHAERLGYEITNVYSDHHISGSSLRRPGIQGLLSAMAEGEFEVIIAEAMDRLSRDQEDIAHIFKRAQFREVEINTISEGVVNDLHIGLTGTMNALQLKEIAKKVRRGMRGRVESGKSAGGIPYGYRAVRQVDAQGNLVRGDREIVPEQAEIVQRILTEYASGQSPKAIAAQLNKEGIPGPSGKDWGQSAINGNRQRGIGILNNEIYVGVLVWNRQSFIKDPSTGKRVPRFNPEEEWIRHDVPELRIVDQELWDAVKKRQKSMAPIGQKFWKAQRPKYLLTGLMKCGCCGGGFSKANHNRYGCSTRANKGTCDNHLKIKQEVVEEHILHALQEHLMDEELCRIFCEEYVAHMNELRSRQNATVERYKAELAQCEVRRENLIQAIYDGVNPKELKAESHQIGQDRERLERLIANAEVVPPILHPNMANHYRAQVKKIISLLDSDDSRAEASEILRSLISKIELVPNADGTELVVNLYGDLAGIMNMATNQETQRVSNGYDISVVKLVAEEGLEPPTRGYD